MADVGSWQEKVLVAISRQGGSDINFAANLDELSAAGFGNRPVEFVNLLNSGFLEQFSPEEAAEITMSGRFVGAGGDMDTAASVNKLFFANVNYATSGYYYLTSLFPDTLPSRRKYRLTLLWTTDTTMSDATAEVPSDHEGERYVFADGFITANDMSFSDKVLTAEITMKFAPRDRDNKANYFIADNVGCDAALPSIGSYTSDSKGW